MFEKVLVANRGEIAVRIQQTLQSMGIRTVAVYSDPDRVAPHVQMADEAFPLRGSSPLESYLDTQKVIHVARQSNAAAIHPGYGFLAESPKFARACEEAGIAFIGPPSDVIELMGDKGRAKETAKEAGTPVMPSVLVGERDQASLVKAGESLGFPVMAKAVAGGGGRGLRLIERAEGLAAEVDSASREALAAFGDGRVLLEEWMPRARHVEVQVLGDHHGNVVHLFERECSIQRRHQKLVEETPSPALKAGLRQAMTQAALAVAKAVGYRNAGTVEFLLAPDGRFFFLEMNTRLQVEHPITEAVTGLDLVREQVRIASGEPLAPGLERLRPKGHAIECRIYAEEPYAQFAPSAGSLLHWAPPSGPGVRVDSGVALGQRLSTEYDSLIAKVTTWGPDRPAALARMEWALGHLVVLGVATTASFLATVIRHPAFASGQYHTRFLEERPELFEQERARGLDELAPALAAWAASGPVASRRLGGEATAGAGEESPWRLGGPWRLA